MPIIFIAQLSLSNLAFQFLSAGVVNAPQKSGDADPGTTPPSAPAAFKNMSQVSCFRRSLWMMSGRMRDSEIWKSSSSIPIGDMSLMPMLRRFCGEGGE